MSNNDVVPAQPGWYLIDPLGEMLPVVAWRVVPAGDDGCVLVPVALCEGPFKFEPGRYAVLQPNDKVWWNGTNYDSVEEYERAR